jgi:hypothetical protein
MFTVVSPVGRQVQVNKTPHRGLPLRRGAGAAKATDGVEAGGEASADAEGRAGRQADGDSDKVDGGEDGNGGQPNA